MGRRDAKLTLTPPSALTLASVEDDDQTPARAEPTTSRSSGRTLVLHRDAVDIDETIFRSERETRN